MAAYELKEGQGVIFKNTKKEKDTHPDYNGTIKTPSGEELSISLWVKESQKGTKYFSVSVKEPYKGQQQSASSQNEDSDDLPF